MCVKSLSCDRDVRGVVGAHMHDYQVETIVKLGEGVDNIAYVVNDELIARISKESDPEQRAVRVHREASVLAAVASVLPLPVPTPRFTSPEKGCLAYFKIPGVPLWDLPPQQRLAHAASMAVKLGEFLRAMHAVPVGWMADLIDTDDDRPAEWRREAAESYPKVAAHVPLGHRRAIEAFLDSSPPDDGYALVFSHNDLGIEHVLVDPGTWTVTGIIDWSDAAIADPAYDFGLLYRDLGPRALDAAIGSYQTDLNDVESLRRRAVFYARCSVFEDLAYGIEMRRDSYVDNSIAAIERLFPTW
jgi:aminoglycoside phosphotransferase (APT) family kinase protein